MLLQHENWTFKKVNLQAPQRKQWQQRKANMKKRRRLRSEHKGKIRQEYALLSMWFLPSFSLSAKWHRVYGKTWKTWEWRGKGIQVYLTQVPRPWQTRSPTVINGSRDPSRCLKPAAPDTSPSAVLAAAGASALTRRRNVLIRTWRCADARLRNAAVSTSFCPASVQGQETCLHGQGQGGEGKHLTPAESTFAFKRYSTHSFFVLAAASLKWLITIRSPASDIRSPSPLSQEGTEDKRREVFRKLVCALVHCCLASTEKHWGRSVFQSSFMCHSTKLHGEGPPCHVWQVAGHAQTMWHIACFSPGCINQEMISEYLIQSKSSHQAFRQGGMQSSQSRRSLLLVKLTA